MFLLVFIIIIFPKTRKNLVKRQIDFTKEVVEDNKESLKNISKTYTDINLENIEKISGAVKKGFETEKMFCKNCGETIDASSNYCKSCGKRVD